MAASGELGVVGSNGDNCAFELPHLQSLQLFCFHCKKNFDNTMMMNAGAALTLIVLEDDPSGDIADKGVRARTRMVKRS